MVSYLKIFTFGVFCILNSSLVFAGNENISSFSQAKKLLSQVYADHKETLYCGAKFNADNTVILPDGFHTPKHERRSKRIEWEHVVPAENFGRTFSEWKEGHSDCVDSKGKSFKGRNCAEKISQEYRLMQSDMHNLFPAIGSVNAMRSNFNFTELSAGTPNTFGSCTMKIDGKKVEPPDEVKGIIARTYFYMEQEYPRFKISKQMKQLLTVWDKKYPVSEWECIRSKRIEEIQGNPNKIVNERCNKSEF
ncbi:MAG: endonuclease I [Alphaproteobacteria bacterium]|nr:endonuclease I [Alphaproteobacteria bacterium]